MSDEPTASPGRRRPTTVGQQHPGRATFPPVPAPRPAPPLATAGNGSWTSRHPAGPPVVPAEPGATARRAPTDVTPAAERPPVGTPAAERPPAGAAPRRRGSEARLLLTGLVVGSLAFGAAGYSIGAAAQSRSAPAPGAAAAMDGTTLPPHEATQYALNRSLLDDDLAALAEPWLARVSACSRSGNGAGPEPRAGEQTRITCRYGSTDVAFVRYRSADDRDRALRDRLQQNAAAAALAPGAAPPALGAESPGGGNCIEFAYQGVAGVVAGIWWDRSGTLTAGYLETPWREGLGGGWEPLRDIWHRWQ